MFEEQNQNIQKETPKDVNTPKKEVKKKIQKSKSELLKENSKYIAPILLNFNISENNKKLEEMLSDLEIFRDEYKEKIEKNIIDIKQDNSTNSTKLLIYNALEKNLIEISYIANKEIRKNRINSLYLWYKQRNKISDDLKKINVKSYKEKNEINDEDLMKIKEEEAKNQQIEGDNSMNNNKKIFFKKINNRNEDLINKKMLEEYQRKILSKSINEKKIKSRTRNNIQKDNNSDKKSEKNILSTTISTPTQDFWAGDYSTFYSFKNGTNYSSLRKTQDKNMFNNTDLAKGGEVENNFFPKFNKSGIYFPPLNRETKFSYSYNRPPYDFNTMLIENGIKENKLKLISEKRSQEEIKEHLDKFGVKCAKYREEMNNKYELKSVINMYVNSNDFKSPLLEKYKIKSVHKNKSVSNDIHNNLYQTLNKQNTKFIIGVSSLDKKNFGNNTDNNNEEYEEFEKMLDEQRIELISPRSNDEVENDNKNSKKSKKAERSASQKIIHKNKIFKGLADKIRINEVKNIDKNTKNILEHHKINKIKLKIKLPKEKIQAHMLNCIQKKSEKISSDVIPKLMSNDSLFKGKKTFESICNVNPNTKTQEKSFFDNKSLYSMSRDEDESSYHNFCLSMYDLSNLKKIDDHTSNMNKYYGYNNINKKNLKDSKIKFNKLHRTFHLFKDNLLNLRRTMSDWKENEYINLVNEMRKNNKKDKKERDRDRDRDRDDRENIYRCNSLGFKNLRMKKQMSLLNAIMNPKDDFGYSQYFLPRTELMLLSRIEESKNKKKK